MRSIAAESDRAYIGGPQDVQYYQQSAFTPLEAGSLQDDLQFSELLAKVRVEGQYANHLDWFSVDLKGEHSAINGLDSRRALRVCRASCAPGMSLKSEEEFLELIGC